MELPSRFGLQKTSLIDYPGKVAPVLFFPGCDLRCPYCHNPDLVYGRPDGLFSRDEVMEYLKFRAPLLGGVVLSGGEPLLYSHTPDFLDTIKKETGLKVKIDTNGLHPDQLLNLNADYIAMDLKTLPSKYILLGGQTPSAGKIQESLEILKTLGIPFEVRTTIVPSFLSIEEAEEMTLLLKGVSRHFITGFKSGNCLDPDFNSLPEVHEAILEQYLDVFRNAGCSTRIRKL